MKPALARLCIVFGLALVLLLVPCSPVRAEGGVELTSVKLTINGQDQPLDFAPGQLEYHVSYTSSEPVEIAVAAEAAAPCKLRIDNVPYEDGRGSAAWSTAESCIINLQVYYKTHSQLYLIHVSIVPPAAPAPGEGQGPVGEPDHSGQGSNNGGSPASGGQSSNNGGSPVNNGQSDPGQAGAAADPEQPGAAPAEDVHTIHLILYIGAPFLLADETYIPADTSPYLVTDASGGGYTMVPVRFIAEALGAGVSWDGTARKVGIDLDGRHFELVIGELVPGTPVAATIRDSRTFVPLRYVMESFGAQVGWTQAEHRIDIFYTPQTRLK